jgi:hypothetical protein
MTQTEGLSVRRRLAIAMAMAALSGAYVAWFAFDTKQTGLGGSDFDQLWFAARALLNGRDPYALIGPGKEFEWQWPLAYPLSTVVAATPFALLPLLVARIVVAALSAGLFTFAISARGVGVLSVLGSAAMLDSVRAVQLSPLLAASVLLVGVTPAAVLKPNIGFALLAASPRRGALVATGLTSMVLVVVAFLAQPAWLSRWRDALASLAHLRIPALSFGGPFLLLALLRWRRLDARVLLACAVVPHTPSAYDVLPLALVARNRREGLAFALLTYVALTLQIVWMSPAPAADRPSLGALILNICVYLPALAAVLARPNESESDAADGLLGRWTRGRPAAA